MNATIKPRLLIITLAGFALLLPSCSLFIEAIDISTRRSQKIPKGTPVSGAGFVVQCPGSYHYPVMNLPIEGAVTFRPTETFADGEVYFVAPFKPVTANTPEQALAEWNQHARKPVQVLKTERSSFKGRQAVIALLYVPQGHSGMLASVKVVTLESSYLIITRSDSYFGQPQLKNVLDLCVRDRVAFEKCITLTR